MTLVNRSSSTLAVFAAGILVLASCTSEKKPEPVAPTAASADGRSRTVTTQPGEAGGVVEDTFTTSATVTALEPTMRKITLTANDGSKTTLTAGPEIRNFPQIKVGDKVSATVAERLQVFVRSSGESPSVTYDSGLAAAPKGAKPGVLVGEAYEVIATVAAIDRSSRMATLRFSDNSTRTFPVRSDVELSRYKIGDSVVIRAKTSLSVVVVTKP